VFIDEYAIYAEAISSVTRFLFPLLRRYTAFSKFLNDLSAIF